MWWCMKCFMTICFPKLETQALHRLVILLFLTRLVGWGKENVDSYSNVFKVQGKDRTSLHPRLECSVKTNDLHLDVMSIILITVGGLPNQVTHLMHMGTVHFSNVWSIQKFPVKCPALHFPKRKRWRRTHTHTHHKSHQRRREGKLIINERFRYLWETAWRQKY